MSSSPDRRQLAYEVQAIARINAASSDPRVATISPDVIVHPLPPEQFHPPSFLTKTASPALVNELDELFQQLRTVHEEHLGEKVLDVVAYYSVTGLKRELEERLRSWGERYFRLRADPRHVNPVVHNDPYLLFEKRVKECDVIFGRLARTETAVPRLFLGLTCEYVPWLLYTLLWRDQIQAVLGGWDLRYCPADPEVPLRMGYWLEATGWQDNRLVPFLCRLADVVPPQELKWIGQESDQALRVRLSAMAADCQEMRPLLVRNFRPYKTAIKLSEGLTAAWVWGYRQGIAFLNIAATVEEIQVNAQRFRSEDPIAVNYEGLLFDWRMPWLRADDCVLAGVRPLVLNCYLLEQLHAKLFGFYDRIDFAKLRQVGREDGLDAEAEQEAVASACHLLAGGGSESATPAAPSDPDQRRLVRSLKSDRLLRLIADRYGCEVRPGKGSEVVIYRPGAKVFTLGHHKRNFPVHPVTVQRMLKRLGIPVREWLDAVGH